MPAHERDDDIEFVGAAAGSVEPVEEDLLDVGRESRLPKWVRAEPRWTLAAGACLAVAVAGVIVATTNSSGHRPASIAAPPTSSPSVEVSLGPPDVLGPIGSLGPVNGVSIGAGGVGGSRIVITPIGTTTAVNRPSTFSCPSHAGCGYPAWASGPLANLVHRDLPDATVSQFSYSWSGGPIQSVLPPKDSSLRARLHGRLLTVTMTATTAHTRTPPARRMAHGTLYRSVLVEPGLDIEITVTGKAGWQPPIRRLNKLAEDLANTAAG